MDKNRFMTAEQVADYLAISRNMVDKLVRQKKLPEPIRLTPRIPRWDRAAVDAAMTAGAGSPTVDREAEIDAWFEQDNRRRAERAQRRQANAR